MFFLNILPLGRRSVQWSSSARAVVSSVTSPCNSPPRSAAFNALIPQSLRNLWRADKETPDTPEPNYVALLNATLDIMSDQIRRSRLAGDPPQVLLGARLKGVSIMDLHRARECIDEGRRMVRAQSEHIAVVAGL